MVYNVNFEITINKLSNLGKNLLINLLLVVYFHRIKAIYLNFTAV